MTTINLPVQLDTIPTTEQTIPKPTPVSIGDAHDAYDRVIYLNSTEAFREADRLLGDGCGVKEVTSAHVTLTRRCLTRRCLNAATNGGDNV